MSKEYLEALDWLLANEMIYRGKTKLPISPALRNIKQHLESIDNANHSEALECLEKLMDSYNARSWLNVRKTEKEEYNTIKQALIKAQEQEKVLEIIKEKGVDVGYLKTCKTLEEYNSNCWNDDEDFNKKITQEEFDLLKRYCNKSC